MASNLANLNPFIKRAMTKRPRRVYYAQSSPVVKEKLNMYNMSRAWADWHCLSYEWRQCESLRSGIGEEYRFPTSFPFLKQLLTAESRGFL